MKKTKLLCLVLTLVMAFAWCVSLAGAESRDETVDFVVVGAGAAGVSAATEAARQGKSVILLEKLGIAGGSSAMNEGYLWACESQFNAETGKGYSKEQMKSYLRASSRGNANDALNDNLVDMSSEIMDLIVEGGAKFYTDRFTTSGADAQDLDVFIAEGAGNGLFQSLLSIAGTYGVVPRYNSPAVALLVEDGVVKGVTVEDKMGRYNVYAGTTVLATGGFLRSDELMNTYMPEWNSEYPYCTAGAEGDGHKWALELGAYMNGYGCGGVWRTEDGKNGFHVEGGLAPCLSFFAVNIEGNRFCNEYMGSDKNQLINMQPGKKSYNFADSTSPYAALIEQGVANGYAYKADTLEELCEVYGINKDNLLKTVEAYNACKASGGEDPFGVPAAYMTSMTTAPYYMSMFDPSFNTNCLMGIAVDEYCRVIREDGSRIEGLYAIGEMIMGNICGGTTAGPRYPSCGSCLAAGIYGGPLAVRHAVGIYE